MERVTGGTCRGPLGIPVLGGSWVVISGRIRPLIWLIIYTCSYLLITPTYNYP